MNRPRVYQSYPYQPAAASNAAAAAPSPSFRTEVRQFLAAGFETDTSSRAGGSASLSSGRCSSEGLVRSLVSSAGIRGALRNCTEPFDIDLRSHLSYVKTEPFGSKIF